MTPLGTPTQGTLLPLLFDVKYLDFETFVEVGNVRSWSVGAAAGPRGRLPGPRRAEGVRGVRRSGVRRRHGLRREPGVPPGPVLGGTGGGGRARRGVPVPARAADAARGVIGAGHDGRSDRQSARAERLLRPKRRVRVQPGAHHRRPRRSCDGAGPVLAGLRARARPVGIPPVVRFSASLAGEGIWIGWFRSSSPRSRATPASNSSRI